jgi:hypothetical protein
MTKRLTRFINFCVFLAGYHVIRKVSRHQEGLLSFSFLHNYEQNLRRICAAGVLRMLSRGPMENGCAFALIFAGSIIFLKSSGGV